MARKIKKTAKTPKLSGEARIVEQFREPLDFVARQGAGSGDDAELEGLTGPDDTPPGD